MAIALILALVVVACGSDSTTTEDPDETATTTTDATTETTTASAGTATTAEDATTTTAATPDTTGAQDVGGVLNLSFAAVPEGTWEVESLGTVFDIEIKGDWWVQPNETGWIVFTAPDSVGPGDQDVVFMRPTALIDPTAPDSGDHWPVEDIEGWLDATGDRLAVTEPASAEVGGAEGIVIEVEATSDSVEFVENGDVSGKRFDPGQRYVVYWLDQGDHEPIAIIVGDHTDSFNEWAPTAESLLENVTFGEPAPHPNT